ncbi:MAG: hypothetical protein ACK5MB_06245 [Phycisphaerales bacterium]|jgi:hypothetical protein
MNRVAIVGNVLAADTAAALTPRQIGDVTRQDVLAALMPANAGGARQVRRVDIDRNGPEGPRAMLKVRAAMDGVNDTGVRVAIWAIQQRAGPAAAGGRDGTISLLGTATVTTGTVLVGASGGDGQIPNSYRWAKFIDFAPSPEYQADLAAMGRGSPVAIDPAAGGTGLELTTPAALILPAPSGAEALLVEAFAAASGSTAAAVAVEVGSV